MRRYFVYLMASKKNGVLYVGVTNDLSRRNNEHKAAQSRGFTQKYWVRRLVYAEAFDSPDEAIRREKNIKAWQRAWKVKLIEGTNPNWDDLAFKLFD